jgi:hypothetical protein
MVMRSVRFQKYVDYLCYTPEEFETIKDASSVIEDALEESIKALASVS